VCLGACFCVVSVYVCGVCCVCVWCVICVSCVSVWCVLCVMYVCMYVCVCLVCVCGGVCVCVWCVCVICFVCVVCGFLWFVCVCVCVYVCVVCFCVRAPRISPKIPQYCTKHILNTVGISDLTIQILHFILLFAATPKPWASEMGNFLWMEYFVRCPANELNLASNVGSFLCRNFFYLVA